MSATAPEAGIAHESPGRLRLKVPACKGDYDFFAELAEAAMELGGVLEVKANPATASLLLLHERAEGRSLARELETAGRIELVQPAYLLGAAAPPEDRMSGRMLLVAGLSLLGLLQVVRGQALGPAAALFWMAREVWKRPEG